MIELLLVAHFEQAGRQLGFDFLAEGALDFAVVFGVFADFEAIGFVIEFHGGAVQVVHRIFGGGLGLGFGGSGRLFVRGSFCIAASIGVAWRRGRAWARESRTASRHSSGR